MTFHEIASASFRKNQPSKTGGLKLQRKCACSGRSEECECAARGGSRRKLHRNAAARNATKTAPAIVHDVVRLPGRPLDGDARARLESSFGRDFSGVRVHTDSKAAASASVVNARAYTAGSHVVFARGQYAPSSDAGRRLLAHELTHVVQQRQAVGSGALALDDPRSAAEAEAERMEKNVGASVGQSRQRSVQRQPGPDDGPAGAGPPLPEMPLPPRCSIIWKDGEWSWKCESVPVIGSTPEIPLDPRDIPDRLKDLIPKGDEPGGKKTFPLPPTSGSELPPDWLENLCKRDPKSVLCIPLGEKQKPDQPEGPALPTKPIGVFWTWDVLFEHDQPAGAAGASSSGITPEGARSLDAIISLLKIDPSLRVRLVGRASAEGTPAHNLELSKRRVRAVYQKLEAAGVDRQVIDPLESDGKTDGCTRLEIGVWACGEARATKDEVRPEERKVDATFLRNPPLPAGPLKLRPPSMLRRREE